MNRIKKLITSQYVLLIIILFFAVAIRIHPVFVKTFAFTYDVGRDMLNLSQIVYAHKIPLIGPTTGLPGLFYGPWWYYILTPAFFVSGGNPQGVALFMGLIGIATVVCAYILGVVIEGQLLGVFLAGLMSFSAVTVFLSVQIWNPNLAQLTVILALVLLVIIKKKKVSMWMYVILGFLLGLTIDSEVVFGLLFTTGVFVASIVLLRKEFSRKGMLYCLLGMFIIFSPRIFFEFRHQFVMTTHIFQLLSSSSGSTAALPFQDVVRQRLQMFWDTWDWTFGHITALSIVSLLSVIFQLSIFLKSKNRSLFSFVAYYVLLVSGTFFIGLLFFRHDIFSHYLVALPVYFLIASGICMYAVLKKYFNTALLMVVLSIILLILMNPFSVYADFFGKPWVGDASVYRNQIRVVDYVYKEAAGKQFKFVTYTPAVIDYPYQYLFAWYGPRKYLYAPKSDASLSFFILEPNTQFPSLRLEWLSERQGDGKVVKEKILPGDITVQTRIK